jgi:hypothetical protein
MRDSASAASIKRRGLAVGRRRCPGCVVRLLVAATQQGAGPPRGTRITAALGDRGEQIAVGDPFHRRQRDIAVAALQRHCGDLARIGHAAKGGKPQGGMLAVPRHAGEQAIIREPREGRARHRLERRRTRHGRDQSRLGEARERRERRGLVLSLERHPEQGRCGRLTHRAVGVAGGDLGQEAGIAQAPRRRPAHARVGTGDDGCQQGRSTAGRLCTA